jgi:O-acetyl-ADP-ribose deacetylase (regulator of RNase III)
MESKMLKHIAVELMHGDITECGDDIIVNAANTSLWLGAGVAGAIKAKGGIQIEKEAVQKGPIKPGQAVATAAGRLKARFVIHAAVMEADLRTNEAYIRAATGNALKLAETMGMGSIVFPALGTGVGRFPLEACAGVMMDEVIKFDKTPPLHVKRVKFVLFSKQAYDEFKGIYLKI